MLRRFKLGSLGKSLNRPSSLSSTPTSTTITGGLRYTSKQTLRPPISGTASLSTSTLTKPATVRRAGLVLGTVTGVAISHYLSAHRRNRETYLGLKRQAKENIACDEMKKALINADPASRWEFMSELDAPTLRHMIENNEISLSVWLTWVPRDNFSTFLKKIDIQTLSNFNIKTDLLDIAKAISDKLSFFLAFKQESIATIGSNSLVEAINLLPNDQRHLILTQWNFGRIFKNNPTQFYEIFDSLTSEGKQTYLHSCFSFFFNSSSNKFELHDRHNLLIVDNKINLRLLTHASEDVKATFILELMSNKLSSDNLCKESKESITHLFRITPVKYYGALLQTVKPALSDWNPTFTEFLNFLQPFIGKNEHFNAVMNNLPPYAFENIFNDFTVEKCAFIQSLAPKTIEIILNNLSKETKDNIEKKITPYLYSNQEDEELAELMKNVMGRARN